jgi:sterol desaturase/sphingolipid hydroxylase (fatty acid hydroxylase superfamily)
VDLFTPYALAVNLPYALAVALVAAEVAWLAREPGLRRRSVLRSAATAAGLGGGALIVGVVYTAVLRWSWGLLATYRLEAAADLWAAVPALGAVAAFVAWDAAGWGYHAIGHRTRWGWAAHQAHHSGSAYDATLGLRQTWTPFHGLLVHPLLALAGFDLRVIAVCASISYCWQVLEHTSLPVRLPAWFSAQVMTPAAHRHHHGRASEGVNLGPVLTWWDRLAGTWVPPEVPAPLAYGPAVAASANPVRIQVDGWRTLARPQRTVPSPGPAGTPPTGPQAPARVAARALQRTTRTR